MCPGSATTVPRLYSTSGGFGSWEVPSKESQQVNPKVLEQLRSCRAPTSLTQAVVAIVRQAEAVVAGAAVVAGDVDALVHAARVVLPLTLINVCRGEGQESCRAAPGAVHHGCCSPSPASLLPSW